MAELWTLFLLFLKINLLTTSGPASVGLMHEETVGRLLTEDEFVKAVAFSNLLPGSDALQLAMYVGHQVAGIPGALVALAASILPPTVMMLVLITLVSRFTDPKIVGGFVKGVQPVLVVLLAVTAYKLLGSEGWRNTRQLLIGVAATITLLFFRVPAWAVLIVAGTLGLIFLR